jgi:hypothetical protein
MDHRSASHLAVHMLDGASLAHGLSDSPAGLLAWLLERWNAWSDTGGDVESVFTKDDMLTHATIYWLNNSIATSMRYYANANRYPWTPTHDRAPIVQAPVGVTLSTSGSSPVGTTCRHRACTQTTDMGGSAGRAVTASVAACIDVGEGDPLHQLAARGELISGYLRGPCHLLAPSSLPLPAR